MRLIEAEDRHRSWPLALRPVAARLTGWLRLERVPWLLWGASAVLTALGLLLFMTSESEAAIDPVTAAMALTYPAVGALVLSRERTNATGWLFSSGALLGVAFCAEQYASYASTARETVAAGGWPGWIASVAWTPAFLALRTLVLLVFPGGRPPSPRWRAVVAAVLVSIAAATLAVALAPGPMLNSPADNPVGLEAVSPRAGQAAVQVSVIALGPVCLAGLLVRHHRSARRERAQLRWFTVAALANVLLPLAALAAGYGLLSFDLFRLLAVLTVLALPAAVVLAMVRCGLYDLGVSRTNALATALLVGSGLIAAALGLYWIVAGLLGAPPAAALAVVAIALQPLYRAIRRWVTSALAASRAQSALLGLGRRLGSTVAPQDVLPVIVDTLVEALGAEYVGVAVNDEDGVTIGRELRGNRDALARALVIPLVYQEGVLGQLAVTLPGAGAPVDPADRDLLEDLAGQLAVAVFALRQTAALQRAKQEAVTTREHERLCWRDVIHDTLKPTLIGIGEILDAVMAELAGRGARSGGATQDTAAAQLQERLQYVKACIVGLRAALQDLDPDRKPRTVGELGLVGAVQQRIATFGLRPRAPAVTFEFPDQVRNGLPTRIEVRAYLIVCQAMENADRHADARNCHIGLRVDDRFLHLKVEDDGTAPPDGYRAGEGIRLMSRLAAYHVEDEFGIESTPRGGTAVLARLRLSA